MTVKDYYYQHFEELGPEKKFHFATRMKNYFKTHDFDRYLADNRPSDNLAEVLNNNDFSKVSNYILRKPFFEKYDGVYGVEATLFRVHHLLAEYNFDTRTNFLELYPQDSLYKLADDLMRDEEALRILSTWAVNVIYLTEELFPRGKNVIRELSEWALRLDTKTCDPTLMSYLCTHIVLCESSFYKKNLLESPNLKILRKLIEKDAAVVRDNIETISLDAAIEFLVCCNMTGLDYPEIRAAISKICKGFKKDSPYLINYRRAKSPDSHLRTLSGAEHINVLYIMSGLDADN